MDEVIFNQWSLKRIDLHSPTVTQQNQHRRDRHAHLQSCTDIRTIPLTNLAARSCSNTAGTSCHMCTLCSNGFESRISTCIFMTAASTRSSSAFERCIAASQAISAYLFVQTSFSSCSTKHRSLCSTRRSNGFESRLEAYSFSSTLSTRSTTAYLSNDPLRSPWRAALADLCRHLQQLPAPTADHCALRIGRTAPRHSSGHTTSHQHWQGERRQLSDSPSWSHRRLTLNACHLLRYPHLHASRTLSSSRLCGRRVPACLP